MAIILGSHNTFTYLRATTLIQRIIKSTWNCQRVDYKKQYALGIRCFDVRLHWQKGRWEAAHGGAHFRVDFEDFLRFCNESCNALNGKVYIRLVYESGTRGGEAQFVATCQEWEQKYPKITFFEGVRKKDWKILYEFKYRPNMEQYVSSMQEKSPLKKIQPKRYAQKHNRSNMQKAEGLPDGSIALFDFVDIDVKGYVGLNAPHIDKPLNPSIKPEHLDDEIGKLS